MDRNDPAYRGQSDCTQPLLDVYDPLVSTSPPGSSWRCPTSRLVEGYRQHIRERHLEVGPGTGCFLERSGLPASSPMTILDPNRNVLEIDSRRLRHLKIISLRGQRPSDEWFDDLSP